VKGAGPRLYRVLTGLVEPLAPGVLAVAARAEGRVLRAERLGRGTEPVDTWWHAASLGELAALDPVLVGARARGLAGRFRVTTTSRAGRETARERWNGSAGLAPLDLPRATRRFLDGCRPRALILVETELWLNWLLEARGRGVRVGVVNGRVSDRSWRRYRLVRGALAPALGALRAVA
jgi:3-deoxy-D-manno-octulosonic-acid transferase